MLHLICDSFAAGCVAGVSMSERNGFYKNICRSVFRLSDSKCQGFLPIYEQSGCAMHDPSF